MYGKMTHDCAKENACKIEILCILLKFAKLKLICIKCNDVLAENFIKDS